MDIWKILDINPTRDLKAIKKAYARLSVKYHPEEHPEEFRQLNDAYKAAVKYAKGSLTAQTIPGPSPASVFPVSENEKNIPNQAQEKDEPDFEQLIEQGQKKAQEASRREIDAGLSCVKNLYLKTKKQRLKTLNSFLQSDFFAEFHQDPYFISQFIHILKRCPIDATVNHLIKSAYTSTFFTADSELPCQPLFDFLDKRIKRDSRTRSFITFGIVLIALGAMMVYHFTQSARDAEKYSAANVEAYLEDLYQIDLTVDEPKSVNPEKDPTRSLYPEGRLYTVKTADQSLQDATGFEALWKKNNPEIDLLSDTYARETSDYFAAQCGIDPKGQWAMLDTSFTNLCHLYYSPSEGKEAFVEKFEQYYNAVQTSHYLNQTRQMTVRIQASGSFSASLPLTVDIIKDVPLDKDAFQADFSAYWDEDASKNQLAYQLLNP
ncbi:J domain-containing protein [Eubacterium limosum]|uniref:J domain-containing protein n=1 Tax=Eubacterium limosum TaxID=1736 RepID=UPI0022DF470D|nr:J domain-containing protein [Eubacterium limosum]